jgi:hypothetical protein
LGNGSLRSVYLHESAVIPEMPRTSKTGGGAPPSLVSGLSGRRTLSKDEISNYVRDREIYANLMTTFVFIRNQFRLLNLMTFFVCLLPLLKSGPRKETKQLSRSMSVVAPCGPNKHYKERYNELDYSRSNTNLLLPPRPHSRRLGEDMSSSLPVSFILPIVA